MVPLVVYVSSGGKRVKREMLLCPASLNASQARIRPSTGPKLVSLISYWQPTGDTCCRVSRRTYLSPSSTARACVGKKKKKLNKKTERNQSANKLRVLSQSCVWLVVGEGKEKRPERLWILTESPLMQKKRKRISMVIADSCRCFYSVVHFAKYVKT